ncbi:MAG TPA: dihydrofolate reductase [Candidatus Paceibacterota bacterium]
MIHIIAAIGKNRELGKDNALLWHLPEDLKHFKELTLGHPVIMGRKTYDSILKALGKPLPGRTNIVVTRQESRIKNQESGVRYAHNFEDALTQARSIDENVFVIGGAQIYEQALSHADALHLTLVDDSRDADSFFPPYENLFAETSTSEWRENGDTRYRFAEFQRH